MSRTSKIVIFMFVFLSNLIPIMAEPLTSEQILEQASKLVIDNWKDNYIGKIELTIGVSTMLVDGQQKDIDPGRDTVPILRNDRTMLPVRAIVEEIGGSIGYDDKDKTVLITNEDVKIQLQIDNPVMNINGAETVLDTPPFLENSRTMLPVRAVTEGLGYEVQWNNEEQKITLTKDFQTKRLLVKVKTVNFDFTPFGAEEVVKGPNGIIVLQFASEAQTKSCLEQLELLNEIEYVEPDMYVPQIFSDGVLPNVGDDDIHIYGNGQGEVKPGSYGAERIGAAKYAQYLRNQGKNSQITIAAVDTGVDKNHPYLSGRLLQNGYNFINGSSNPNDDNGHGTRISGIITECTPDLNVKILPVKAFNKGGSSSFLIVSTAIIYAADQGADIINLSFGGSHSQTLEDSVQYAINKGIPVIIASGNQDTNTKYICPAHINNAVVVAAVDSRDIRGTFSNFGDEVDLSAPGVNIISSVPNGKYDTDSGTSMATAHVSASAAMLKMDNPNLTPTQMEAKLKGYIDDVGTPGWDVYYGSGVLNLSKAIPEEIPNRRVLIRTPLSGYAFTVGQQINIKADVVTDVDNFWCGYKRSDSQTFTKISESTSNSLVVWNTTGLREGTYTITYRIQDNGEILASNDIIITLRKAMVEKYVTKLQWTKQEINLDVNDKKTDNIQLIANYSDSSTADVTTEADVFVENSTIATVSNGKITAVSSGTTYLNFKKSYGDTVATPSKVKITVTSKNEVVALNWSRNDIYLQAGTYDTVKLFATYADGQQKDVTAECGLYSNDKKIASIDNTGRITAVAKGETTIYFTNFAGTGVSMPTFFKVKVYEEPDVILNANSIDLRIGGTYQLTASTAVLWFSSDPSVATVSTNGLVTAKSIGTVVVTAYVGSKSATCTVNVSMVLPTAPPTPTPITSPKPTQTPTPTVQPTPTAKPTASPTPFPTPPMSTADNGSGSLPMGNQAFITEVAFDSNSVYYVNTNDYNLYKMNSNGTNKVKLSTQNLPRDINVSGNMVYYVYENGKGISKVSINGGEVSAIVNHNNTYGLIYKMCVVDDYIYFSCETSGIYKLPVNGGTPQRLVNYNVLSSFTVQNGWIYFSEARKKGLYKVSVNGGDVTRLYSDYAQCLNVVGEWIYYISEADGLDRAEGGQIYKIKTDGSGRALVWGGTYRNRKMNVDSGWIYFMRDSIQAISKVKIDGTGFADLISTEQLKNSSLRSANFINGDWIYFTAHNKNYSTGNSELYRIKKDGTNLLLLQGYKS